MSKMLRCSLPVILICFALVFLLHLSASGELRRIEILSHEPWLGGKLLGKAGAYEKVRGRAYFAVDPSHPANQRIADITLAPHNAQAQVEFWGDFVVLRPADPSKARATALVEIPNRGVTQMHGFFFRVAAGSQFALPDPSPAGLELSFPFDEGFTVAWMGWQFDVPAPGMALKVPHAPVNSVVRAVHIRGAAERDTTSFSLARPGFYCADDPSQADAVLTVQSRYDEAPQSVPRAQWSFSRQERGVSTPDPCRVTLPQGFERGKIYQVLRSTFPQCVRTLEAPIWMSSAIPPCSVAIDSSWPSSAPTARAAVPRPRHRSAGRTPSRRISSSPRWRTRLASKPWCRSDAGKAMAA